MLDLLEEHKPIFTFYIHFQQCSSVCFSRVEYYGLWISIAYVLCCITLISQSLLYLPPSPDHILVPAHASPRFRPSALITEWFRCLFATDIFFCSSRISATVNNRVHVSADGRLPHFDGVVKERRNSIANALELCLSCTNPLIWFSDICRHSDDHVRVPTFFKSTVARFTLLVICKYYK